MTQQAELLHKFERLLPILPPKYFGEIIDFMGYLQYKAQHEAAEVDMPLSDGNNGKIRFTRKEFDEMVQNSETLRSLSGILSGMGDVDLDEMRMKRLAKHL
jgi:hypothetical protein